MLAGTRSRWMIGGEGAAPVHPLAVGQTAAEVDLRPLARRLMLEKFDRAPLWMAVFAARRGHVLHPADWIPPPAADLPDVYRPFQQWQAGQSDQATVLTSATWLDLPKAERRTQFAALRQADPAATLQLLADHFAPCPADDRLAFVDALVVGLTTDDAAFLQGLAKDRSEKVRKAVAHLLARLGLAEADPLASEAAAMFEVASKGLVFPQTIVRINPKAKERQMRSLLQTLPAVSLHRLASALGLASAEFVAMWSPDNASQRLLFTLTATIARKGTVADVVAYWAKLRDQPDIVVTCLPSLYLRLGAASKQEAMLLLIARSGLGAAADILSLKGAAVPASVSAALTALTAQRKVLVDLVRQSQNTAPEKAAKARAEALRLANTLSMLGLLLTARDADPALQTVAAARVQPADPMLDRLHFNIALKGS